MLLLEFWRRRIDVLFTQCQRFSRANIGMLVVIDILNKHLFSYSMIFLLSAAAFGLTRQRLAGDGAVNIVVYAFVAVLAFNQLRVGPKVFANFHVFLAYFQRALVLIHDMQGRVKLPASSVQSEEDRLEEEM